MTGKTHQTGGWLATAIYLLFVLDPAYQPATLAMAIALSSIGSMLPDCDQPTAEAWNHLPLGHTFGHIANHVTLGHRNITHSLLGFTALSGLVYIVVNSFPVYWNINTHIVIIAFMLSYALHLLFDSFTVEGIPLLFPYQRMFGIPPKPFEGIRILSGKWFENLVIFPAINLTLIIVLIASWTSIKTLLFK